MCSINSYICIHGVCIMYVLCVYVPKYVCLCVMCMYVCMYVRMHVYVYMYLFIYEGRYVCVHVLTFGKRKSGKKNRTEIKNLL